MEALCHLIVNNAIAVWPPHVQLVRIWNMTPIYCFWPTVFCNMPYSCTKWLYKNSTTKKLIGGSSESLLTPKILEVVRTYKWYFCDFMNAASIMGIPWCGVFTQTIPHAKEFLWWKRKIFRCKHSHPGMSTRSEFSPSIFILISSHEFCAQVCQSKNITPKTITNSDHPPVN